MVHATWGDWFVREEVEGTQPQGMAVWYLGCNGFVV
ncbi:MAG: MBL fold metallo-hydrolase, partial [Halobacteriales archaeon]